MTKSGQDAFLSKVDKHQDRNAKTFGEILSNEVGLDTSEHHFPGPTERVMRLCGDKPVHAELPVNV